MFEVDGEMIETKYFYEKHGITSKADKTRAYNRMYRGKKTTAEILDKRNNQFKGGKNKQWSAINLREFGDKVSADQKEMLVREGLEDLISEGVGV